MPTELSPLDARRSRTRSAARTIEFRGVFSRETSRRALGTASYAHIGDRPTVGPNFLPVIVERFARERLEAVAQAEGLVRRALPEVLFVCERNAGRSQIAARSRISCQRAGSRSARPGLTRRADRPVVVEAMASSGARRADEFPKPLTDAVLRSDVDGLQADRVPSALATVAMRTACAARRRDSDRLAARLATGSFRWAESNDGHRCTISLNFTVCQSTLIGEARA